MVINALRYRAAPGRRLAECRLNGEGVCGCPGGASGCRRTARRKGTEPVEIITWNVNSVRARLPRVAALLARRQPDLVCLQEIKVSPQDFPAAEFAALGYASAVHGQEGRNGVAMLARAAPADVVRGFDADPAPGQARVLSAAVGRHAGHICVCRQRPGRGHARLRA